MYRATIGGYVKLGAFIFVCGLLLALLAGARW